MAGIDAFAGHAVALARLAGGQPLPVTHDRLMPRYVAGRSIARSAPVLS
jgi:hypothetical protein